MYAQAACTYRGRLFVIGSAWFEPEQRLFRATALNVPEYPGDIPCEKEEPTPDPDPVSKPTPAPNPSPSPKPSSSPTPNSSKTLPATGDLRTPTPTLIGMGVCGVAAVLVGAALRKRNGQRPVSQR